MEINVYKIEHLYVNNFGVAEEVVQDVFIDLYMKHSLWGYRPCHYSV